MAININKCDEKTKNNIIVDYKNNMSIRALEEKYSVTRTSISKFLTELGVKTTVGNHYRKYTHNENFFEVIDNQIKAYWLGFMFADGYITNKSNDYGQDQFGICISEIDIKLLEDFIQDLSATNPINRVPHYGTDYNDCLRVHLTSQKTVDDLISHGCVKQKTLILQPPKDIPEELVRHFIRGLFDGDGCISSSASPYPTKPYQISFTTTKEIAFWLKEIIGYGSVFQDKRRAKTWIYNFGGNQQVKNFCEWIYKDAKRYLSRKYIKYQELLSQYGESQGNNG